MQRDLLAGVMANHEGRSRTTRRRSGLSPSRAPGEKWLGLTGGLAGGRWRVGWHDPERSEGRGAPGPGPRTRLARATADPLRHLFRPRAGGGRRAPRSGRFFIGHGYAAPVQCEFSSGGPREVPDHRDNTQPGNPGCSLVPVSPVPGPPRRKRPGSWPRSGDSRPASGPTASPSGGRSRKGSGRSPGNHGAPGSRHRTDVPLAPRAGRGAARVQTASRRGGHADGVRSQARGTSCVKH
jgi:hypothetical protein